MLRRIIWAERRSLRRHRQLSLKRCCIWVCIFCSFLQLFVCLFVCFACPSHRVKHRRTNLYFTQHSVRLWWLDARVFASFGRELGGSAWRIYDQGADVPFRCPPPQSSHAHAMVEFFSIQNSSAFVFKILPQEKNENPICPSIAPAPNVYANVYTGFFLCTLLFHRTSLRSFS